MVFQGATALVSLIAADGLFAQKMPDFEVREGQIKMLKAVSQAFEEERTALVEAGTGTGKSIAYLIPTIFAALEKGETTVVSTHTISLQEQLLKKDIPFLLSVLDVDLKVILIKGMQNYVCKRKLYDLQAEEEVDATNHLVEMVEGSRLVSRSDLPFALPGELWDQIKAESESCSYQKCPHFNACPFFSERKEAENAKLLIVNHHLLCADLAVRLESDNFDAPAILPSYQNVIVDEAHHLANVASACFSRKTSQIAFSRILSRLYNDQGKGKLFALRKKILDALPTSMMDHPVLDKIDLSLLSQKRDLAFQIHTLFEVLSTFLNQKNKASFRLKEADLKSPAWEGAIQEEIAALVEEGKGFVVSLKSLEKGIDDPLLLKKCEGILSDIHALARLLEGHLTMIHEFAFEPLKEDAVRFLEKSTRNLMCQESKLDSSEQLSSALFSPFKTVVLTSATLATNRDFSFIQKQLGINDEPILSICDSPFDFTTQAHLFVPNDLPSPDAPGFVPRASECIEKALLASRGNAFVLFTSFSMLRACKNALEGRLKFPLLCQGETSRSELLAKFRRKEGAVLFGTDSFWEGVDVTGDKLRLVIIAKLPFKVPSEPLTEARAEMLTKAGKSPFFDEALPQAVMKFKQGFGRLIRHKNDRGAILILDGRLIKKGYGKQFLKSLPTCPIQVDPTDIIGASMAQFYKTRI